MALAHKMQRRGFWWCAFALACLLVTVLAADPQMARADEDAAETVRVGYYENEVFQEGAQEGAVKTGYAYEYYRKISEYTGWKYEYVYGDYADLYQMLLDGDIDLLAGLAWKEDRVGLIGYPQAAMGSESYSLVKHVSSADITADPSTLQGKRIGVLDSALADVLNKYLDEHGVKADVVLYQDYETLFAAFDSEDVDVLAAEGDGAYGRADAEVTTSFGASDYYLCVNVRRSDLLEELDAAQAQLSRDEPNYLNSLHARYYPISVSSRAFSEVEREWVDQHDTMRVGYLNHYLPYSDTDDRGNVTGVVSEMVPQMLENLGIDGIEVQYQGFDSYDDMIAAIGSDQIDVAFPVGGGLYYSEENGIYQSNPVASTSTELVYRGEYTDATLSHFAVNENNRMQYYYVVTNFPDSEITLYPSIDACLKAVISGEVSCTTLNGLRADDILKNREYNGLFMRQLNQNDDRCFGVQIGDEGLLKLLNRGINVLGADYAITLASRYTDELYTYTVGDFVADNAALFALAALAIAALIILSLVRESKRTKRQKEVLAVALKGAEQANRAKTTFLNSMSHDIRTPMNAIVGFTKLAESHIDDEEQVRDYLGKISVSSQHLLSLINDVLEMSRIESGKVTIKESHVHLPDLVTELQTVIQADVTEKRQTLTVDMSKVEDEDIVTDRLRLSQVLLNILSNATKFTPEGGSIDVSVVQASSDAEGRARYEFRVKDDGVGMSERFQENVFEPFTREQTSTVSGIQGTGLGMAITKNIVDMLNGTITVSSTEGEGSEFVVSIPCKVDREHGHERTGQPEAQSDLQNVPESAPSFSGKRVLLVEDNVLNQQIAQVILEEAGFEVDIACDGEEAVGKVESAASDYYDVVLMDIQMPRMDGYEATRLIRSMEDPAKAGIPIIAVTANAFEEDRKAALDAGMNGHLAKPYDVHKMMETLSANVRGTADRDA